MSYADQVFKDSARQILDQGSWQAGKVRAVWPDGTPARTKKLFALMNRYDLQKEFPILTLRPVPLQKCVDELLWIWQKKSNRLEDLNSHIWDAWAKEDGTIGKAYGYQLAKKTRYSDGEFDQVDRLIKDIKETPESRRLICHMYNIEDLPEMSLYPCAYSMTFHVDQGRLSGLLNQRSQDMLVANGWNVVQYAILLHMLARECGLEVGELVHVIADAHIYDRHIPLVEELLSRESYPAPRLVINPKVKGFYDFKPSDFQLENYQHGPQLKDIPVAI
ncbi:MAG: thymidylate synthase [Eubacteriales bacterium]|nr:thymidylate synthase [Eubacteriales bacterium]